MCICLLETAQLIPNKPTTMHGVGYALYGRWAIFVMAFLSTALASGLCMCYLIVLGETTVSLVEDVFGVGKSNLFDQKETYILSVTLV